MEGLAQTLVYDGSQNTTKHYYSGKAKAKPAKIKQKKKD